MAYVINTVEGEEMEIIVCVKPVLDPDMPPMKFSIDSGKNCVIPPEGIPAVINPYDALAVEAAIRIKEQQGGKITAVTLAKSSGEDVLRKALAMGADEACLISDDSMEEYDGFTRASVLAQAVKKIGAYDLILCGRQAADWDLGITGSIIAEYLSIPVITRAKKISVANGKFNVERITAWGNEVYEMEAPALITISNEFGQARIPSGWGIVSATRKQITKWTSADMGNEIPKTGGGNILMKLYPASNNRNCEFIKSENMAEAASRLAGILAGLAK